ncbi:MAG: type II toxin-antitoxin system RelE/ParE family toxin [Proteobacteria bacterium]|nr:type II toxin-antitoxin system RelE/ParE family toxin [Pseudomonadota bacterium]
MSVTFTRRALRDLAHIREYIGAESPIAASRMAVELVAACDRLELFPERGRPGLIEGTRELTTVWPYVIVYKINGDRIDVLSIWHGKQHR